MTVLGKEDYFRVYKLDIKPFASLSEDSFNLLRKKVA